MLHPATLLALDALSFAASALFINRIARPLHDGSRERPPLSRTVLLADIKEGVVYLARHAGVRR